MLTIQKLFADYETSFKKSLIGAISMLCNYKDSQRGKIVVPFLKKIYNLVIVQECATNLPPSPIIIEKSNGYVISCENQEFEQVKLEEEAIFNFIPLHTLLKVKFSEGLKKNLDKILK